MSLVSRDPYNVVVAVQRNGSTADESILFAHNMTPEIRGEYRIGVDQPGAYREILNTDLKKYGGSDVKNGVVQAEAVPMHGKPYSVLLTLPPLATIALKKTESADV
jgi:1,4-alpha-glucan branching enzyme